MNVQERPKEDGRRENAEHHISAALALALGLILVIRKHPCAPSASGLWKDWFRWPRSFLSLINQRGITADNGSPAVGGEDSQREGVFSGVSA